MGKISKEDYRSLELKIHNEIKKIFLQFMEDLENKTVESSETVTTQGLRNPRNTRKLVPPEQIPALVEPRGRRKSKKAIDMKKLLHSSSYAGTSRPEDILESDMAKIFRKKHQRGSK
jgi:hypothetical protein